MDWAGGTAQNRAPSLTLSAPTTGGAVRPVDVTRLVALGWENRADTNDPIDADSLLMHSASVVMPGRREASVAPIRLPATNPGLPYRLPIPPTLIATVDPRCGAAVVWRYSHGDSSDPP